MKTQHIIAISVVLLITAYLLYVEIKHRRFHKHMAIGDACSIHLDADRINCEIYHIEGDTVYMRDHGLNTYTRHRNDVYPAGNPLFYIV